MNPIDIVIIAVLAALICAAAAVIIIRRRKGRSCSGCCDGCPYDCKKPDKS